MDEAERLADELLILREGRVIATGPPRAVLGDWVGEHMRVLEASDPAASAVCAWARQAGLPEPRRVLSTCTSPWMDRGCPVQRPVRRSTLRGPPPHPGHLFLKLAESRDLPTAMTFLLTTGLPGSGRAAPSWAAT